MAQATVNGLVLGGMYAIVALGFVLLYKNTRFLNFAHGDLVTLGAYLGYGTLVTLKLPFYLAALLVLSVLALAGLVIEVLLLRQLRRKALITALVATLGMGLSIRAVIYFAWGPLDMKVPPFITAAPVRVGDVAVDAQSLLILGCAVAVVVALYIVYNRTLLGLQLRAASEDPDMARLMGVQVDRIMRGSFVVSAVLAGLAGMVLAPITFVSLDLGFNVALKAIAASIIGGFGSLPGAIVGGLLLGLLELYAANLISPDFRDMSVYSALLLILLVRPSGVFGSLLEQKA